MTSHSWQILGLFHKALLNPFMPSITKKGYWQRVETLDSKPQTLYFKHKISLLTCSQDNPVVSEVVMFG